MVKTKNNKPLIGKEFIQNLAVDQECKSFTQGKKGVMLCKCCFKFGSNLELVKDVFHALHKEFWDQERPSNIPNKEKAAFEGRKLAVFLENIVLFFASTNLCMSFLCPTVKELLQCACPH